MERTQIYLDEEQRARLRARSEARGRTVSDLIREAIDAYLEHPEHARGDLARLHTALDATFGAAAHLPPGADYTRNLRAGDRARDESLEER